MNGAIGERLLGTLAFAALACLGACREPTVLIDGGLAQDVSTLDVPSSLTDTPSMGLALPGLRAAFERSRAAFCTCLPMRNPAATEATCLAASAPRMEIQACEDEAVAAIGSAFDGYYRCRTAAVDALTACYERDCSDPSVMRCNGDFATADGACARLIPRAQAPTFVTAYEDCIRRTVTGEAMSCPDDPSALSSALGAAVFSGSTDLAGNDTEPLVSCFVDMADVMNAAGSPDRSYRWAAPAAGRYQIDTIGTEGFDTLLYVRSACSDAMDLACSDDIELGVDQDSCVTVDLADGEEVVIIVDGFGPLVRGDFVVNVSAVASDAVCPTMAVSPAPPG